MTPLGAAEALDRYFLEARAKLLAVREKRVKPARDEKIITAWNGLMISSFARAGAILGRPDYVAAGERAADYLLEHLRSPDGRLYRTAHSTENRLPTPFAINAVNLLLRRLPRFALGCFGTLPQGRDLQVIRLTSRIGRWVI